MAALAQEPVDVKSAAKARPIAQAYSANAGWEADRAFIVARSERRAWAVAKGAMAYALLATLALVMALKLQKVVPVPIVVDRMTGETTVTKALASDTVPPIEALDKHNVMRFVLARERYNWTFLQGDFDTVAALSAPPVFKEYSAQFEGSNALQSKLGDATEWIVRVVNVRLEPETKPGIGGVAVVTFVKQVRSRGRGADPEARYLATVAYKYAPTIALTEKDRIENPFGFVATAYRADPDINSLSTTQRGGL
jgi:type IV secretion system protein VirB8